MLKAYTSKTTSNEQRNALEYCHSEKLHSEDAFLSAKKHVIVILKVLLKNPYGLLHTVGFLVA